MKLEKEKHYFLKINYKGRILEYEGKVIYLDEKKFGIQTEEECDLRFELKDILSFKEIKKEEKEIRIVVQKKGPLKESEKPKGI